MIASVQIFYGTVYISTVFANYIVQSIMSMTFAAAVLVSKKTVAIVAIERVFIACKKPMKDTPILIFYQGYFAENQ